VRTHMTQPELYTLDRAFPKLHEALEILDPLRWTVEGTPFFELIESIYQDVARANSAALRLLRQHKVEPRWQEFTMPF